MGNTESFMGASLEIETSRRDTRTSEESSLAGESYATDECRSWALPKLMMEAETMEHAESYQEAEELYQTMAQYLEEGSVEMATLQDRMGCLFVRTGRLVEAMKCFRKALNIKKRRSPHSSSVAKTMGNIASVYCGKGEYEKAISVLEDCLAIQKRRNPGSLRYAKVLGNIAVVYSRCERYELAIKFHETSFEIKKLQAPGSLSAATTSLNLADLWMSKDPPKAIIYLKHATIIAETHRPVPDAFLSDVFTVTANILRHAEFYNEAIDMYMKAMLLEEAVALDSEKLETLRTKIRHTQLDSHSSWGQGLATEAWPNDKSTRRDDALNAIAEDVEPLRDAEANETVRLGNFRTEEASAQLSTQESTWVEVSVGAVDGFVSLSSQSFDVRDPGDGLVTCPHEPTNAFEPGNYPQDHIEECLNYAAVSCAAMPYTSEARLEDSTFALASQDSMQDASSDAAVIEAPVCHSSSMPEDSVYQKQPERAPLAAPAAPIDLAEDGDLLDFLVYMADKGAGKSLLLPNTRNNTDLQAEYPEFRQTLSMDPLNPQVSHGVSSRHCVSLPRPEAVCDYPSIPQVQFSHDNSYTSLSRIPYSEGSPEDPLELALVMAKSFPPHGRNGTNLSTKPNRSRRKQKRNLPTSTILSTRANEVPVQESRFPDESPRHMLQYGR